MRALRGLLVLALTCTACAACGGPTHAHAPPPSGAAELPPERATPPPSIEWRDGNFVTTGLPAIARGGEVVVIGYHDADSMRGFPNLRVEVLDRHDQVVWKVPIMVPTEYEQLAPDGAPSVELARRIGHANAELQRLHGVHDLVPMRALGVLPPGDGVAPHMASGDGIDVDWADDHLHVFRHNSERAVVTREGTGWLEPDHKPCAGCDVCHNPAFLDAVFHAPEIQAVLVWIGYKGSDTCIEPSARPHVVAW